MLLLETRSGLPMVPNWEKPDKWKNEDWRKTKFGCKIYVRCGDIGIYMVNAYAGHSPASERTNIPSHMH